MSLSDPIYQAIEIAVKASGAQAVSALDANLLALKQQVAAYQAQLAAGGAVNQKTIADLAKIAAELRDAEEAAAAAGRVMNGLPAKLAQTGSSAQAASRGILELSRGFEDLTTGGFLGVLNNIPGTIYNFGQAAKLSATQVGLLTAAASGLGTAAYIVYQNWDKIVELFGKGVPPKLMDDIKSLTKELKELTEKEWKTRVDARDIDIAKGKIDELTKAKAGYDKLNAPDEATSERAEAVTKAINENKGPGGREALTQAIIAATGGGSESPQAKATREKIEALKAQQTTDIPGESAFDSQARRKLLGGQIKELTESKEGQAAADMINKRSAVEQMLGKAAGGDEMQLRSLMDIIQKRPNKFAAQRIDPNALLGGLQQATPEAVARNKKIDTEYDQAIADTDASIDAVKAKFKAIRKSIKDRAKLDQDVDEIVQEIGDWTSHNVLKGEADTAERDKTAKAKAFREMAQSNQRRSKEQQPGSSVSAQLQTQALMEQTLGIVGPATQQIQQIMANNQLLAMKVRAITQEVNRGRTIRPTRSPNIDR